MSWIWEANIADEGWHTIKASEGRAYLLLALNGSAQFEGWDDDVKQCVVNSKIARARETGHSIYGRTTQQQPVEISITRRLR